jgi:DNA-binding GntR family transcriptional regulator
LSYHNNKQPAAEKAYYHIKAAILAGKYPPGERLVEEKLAAEAGVSRTPVRQALGRIAAEGLIKPMERRGYCFSRDSIEEMEEVFDLRAVLEGYALRLAFNRIDGKVLALLEECVAQAQEALDRGDNHLVFEWNTKFHDILSDLISGRQRIYRLISDMRKYVLRYRKDTLQYLQGAVRSIEGHRRILMALKLGYPDLCERVMREHVMEAKADAYSTIREEAK